MRESPSAAPTSTAAGDVSPPLDATGQLVRYARDLRTALARAREASTALARAHLETVAALAAAIDARDEVTGGHVHRVATYGVLLAEHLAPELRDDPQLLYGFVLHDIGKLAVPDAVLNKPGPLDEDERAALRSHVEHGVRFIEGVTFLRPALTIIATHHETWDGTGYPEGLAGDEIPLGARMFSVCDALDAMLHDRPYRRALPPDRALHELRGRAGRQFDPDVVRAVADVYDRLLAVEDRPSLPGLTTAPPIPSTLSAAASTHPVLEVLDERAVVLDHHGRVVAANAAFRRAFGFDTVPVGLSLVDVLRLASVDIVDLAQAERQFARLGRDFFRGRREGELTVLDPGGRPRELRWYAKLVTGDGAEVAARVVVFSGGTSAAAVGRPG